MFRAPCSLLAIVAVVVACDLPRDADGTIDRVRNGTMRVGVVSNPPWVTIDEGEVGGIEGTLVRELARELNARPVWVVATEEELLASLEKRELDLVIGGLTADVPWKSKVALTKPFYTDTVVVALPPRSEPGATRGEIEGMQVAVRQGDPVAAEVRKKKATPVMVRDLRDAPGPVAAPSWQLGALGVADAGVELRQVPHVLAAPTGENGWLVRIERLLRARRDAIPLALRARKS